MKKNISKVFLLILVFGIIFWLGSFNIRALIGNEFFEFGTLNFKDYLSADFEKATFLFYANITIITLISYVVVLLSAVFYLITAKPNMKEKGWLMASAIMFFIFAPVEIYTGYLDFKFINAYYFFSSSSYHLKELFLKRVTALSGLPAIATFCYYTVLILFVFKPLDKSKNSENK